MLKKLQNHIDKNFPFLKEKKLFLAVSAGIDSVVLLHLLHQLHYKIAVLHCNFSLRDFESDADENFIRSLCVELNIPIYIQKFDTKQFASDYKLSIQLAARKLRYDWFYELLETQNFDYVLTAHHLDDSFETFLINLTRGTGLEGLTGIPSQNEQTIRPLLPFSRTEIEAYAKENNIQWREDSSNASDKYLRNKLRHDVVPILKELNPNFLDSFLKTQNHLKDAQSIVNDGEFIIFKEVVTENEDGIVFFNLNKLLQLPNYSAYLYQWLKEFGFTAWDDIANLVHAQSGKQVFSDDYVLLKDRNNLILTRKNESETNEVYLIDKNSIQVNFPLKFEFCNLGDISVTDSNSIFVDEDLLRFPLQLRKWKEGDFFHPSGMTGKKKVSKYFKDEKLSLIEKSNKWLLCSNNQIVWIVGMRQDKFYKAIKSTKKILKITIQK